MSPWVNRTGGPCLGVDVGFLSTALGKRESSECGDGDQPTGSGRPSRHAHPGEGGVGSNSDVMSNQSPLPRPHIHRRPVLCTERFLK